MIAACYVLDVIVHNVFIAFGAKLLFFAAVAFVVLKFKIIDFDSVKLVVERLAAPLIGKFKR